MEEFQKSKFRKSPLLGPDHCFCLLPALFDFEKIPLNQKPRAAECQNAENLTGKKEKINVKFLNLGILF